MDKVHVLHIKKEKLEVGSCDTSPCLKIEPADDEEFPADVKPIRSVTETNDLKQHLPIQTVSKKESSERLFTRKCDLRSGKRTCTNLKPYLCDICGKVYTSKQALKEHHKTHSGQKCIFTCPICSKQFLNAHNLQRHHLIHTKGRPFQCDICGKSFTQKCTVKIHQRIHTGEKPFVCSICYKGFAQNSNLKTHHKRIHVGGKPSRKPNNSHKFINIDEKPLRGVCSKVDASKCNLQTLRQSPRGSKWLKCNICAKEFPWPSHLNIHYRSHVNERPFSCNICGNMFFQKVHLKSHYERIHIKTTIKATIKTTIKTTPSRMVNTSRSSTHLDCEFCGKVFAYHCSLRNHQKIHTNEKQHCCDICGKAFTQKSTLDEHHWTHSDEKPYYCSVCDKGYIRKSHLRVHLRVHHGIRAKKAPTCFTLKIPKAVQNCQT